jgi:hypothetical protein
MNVFYWFIWVVSLAILFAAQFKFKFKKSIYQINMILILLRSLLPLLDFELRREELSRVHSSYQIALIVLIISLNQIINILVLDKKMSIPLSILASISVSLGIARMGSD